MSKGLDDLKWLIENGYIEEHGWQEDVVMLDCVNNIEKELKALEIIKEKRVNVGTFIKCCANLSYEEYKKQWGNWKKDILYNLSKEPLTKEKYDLLKEVLL